MEKTVFLKIVVYAFSALWAGCFVGAGLSGRALAKRRGAYPPWLLALHRRFVTSIYLVPIPAVLTVEFGLVPIYGRHYSPLFFLHIFCLLGLIIFYWITVRRNGLRGDGKHRVPARITIIFGLSSSALGALLTALL